MINTKSLNLFQGPYETFLELLYALKVCKTFEVVGSANPKNELYTRQAKDPQRSIFLVCEQWKILLNAVDSHL
jgi:hypothetical protein